MSQPKIARVDVWVTCICGEEIHFDHSEPDAGSESIQCEDCGRTVEVMLMVETQDISGNR